MAQIIQSLQENVAYYKNKLLAYGGQISPSEPASPVDGPSTVSEPPSSIDALYKPILDMQNERSYHSSTDQFGVDGFNCPISYDSPLTDEHNSHNRHASALRAPVYLEGIMTSNLCTIPLPQGLSPQQASSAASLSSLSNSHSGLAHFDTDQYLNVPRDLPFSHFLTSSPGGTSPDQGNPSPINSHTSESGSSAWDMTSVTHFKYFSTERVMIPFHGREPLAVRRTSTLVHAGNTQRQYVHIPRDGSLESGVIQSSLQLPYHAVAPPPVYEWNRHIPDSVRAILTRADHDRALNLYFVHTEIWQTPVIRQLFLADMERALGPSSAIHTLHYSPGLHCAILAAACTLARGTALLEFSVRTCLATSAREWIAADCGDNKRILPAILGLTVLARYHLATPGGARMAYLTIGMAGHLALTAGMHMDPAKYSGPADERLERLWCYTSLFNQSVEIAVYTGQEISLPPPWPIPTSHPMISRAHERERALQNVMASHPFIFTSKMFLDISQALEANAMHEHRLSAAECLQDHYMSISPPSSGMGVEDAQLAMLRAASAWACLILHHPPMRDSSRERHKSAAKCLVEIVSTFKDNHPATSIPCVLVDMAFAGGLALLLQAESGLAVSSPPNFQLEYEMVEYALQVCVFLHSVQEIWPCAKGFAEILYARIGALPQFPLPSPDASHLPSFPMTLEVFTPSQTTFP